MISQSSELYEGLFFRGGESMKFYTIKLPKFIGGFVRAVMGSFRKG